MYIDDRELYKKIARIAMPISIQGLVSGTLGLIDTLMVGMLGEAELAAVGVATQIFFVHYLFLYGFNSGAATFMAQFYGIRNWKNIRRVVGFSVVVSGIISAAFLMIAVFWTSDFLKIYSNDPNIIKMAAPYVHIGAVTLLFLSVSVPLETVFKAIQKTRIPMVVSVVAFSANTFINYILIFGKFGAPEMGLSGAAVGTAIARGLEMIISVIALKHTKIGKGGSIREFIDWNRELVRRIIKNSLPTTLNELFWSVGTSMYVAAFSRLGVTSYAAYQAAAAIDNIFAFAAFSIGDSALIMVGERLGSGNKEGAYYMAKKLLKVGVIVGSVCGVILIIGGRPVINLFALSANGKKYAFKVLVVLACLMPWSLFVNINVTGIMRGGGDTAFAAATEIAVIWAYAVPMAFMASMFFGLPVYLAVLCVRSSSVIESFILGKRFFSRKWTNTVIKNL